MKKEDIKKLERLVKRLLAQCAVTDEEHELLDKAIKDLKGKTDKGK